MKQYILLFSGVLFATCSSPKVEYREYDFEISDYSKNQFLTRINAKDSTASVLFLTELFVDSKIKIENNSVIFDSIVNSDRSLGLAHIEKIDNRHDCIIHDLETGKSFQIKSTKSRKYKYIYVGKDHYKNKYSITYSNTHRAFY
ncbi:MAG TPA: hypothetical protein VEA37_01540 [Flavobacterium sp.]|nr:hypothetical protein [Flavobacterium sp.]